MRYSSEASMKCGRNSTTEKSVQIRKRGVVLDQLIGQSRDFLGTQVQEGRCFVDLNDLKRDHLHTLLPCYGWRVVYHLWLGKSRCNTRRSPDSRSILWPSDCPMQTGQRIGQRIRPISIQSRVVG